MATQPDAPTVEVYDEIAGTPKKPVVGLTYDDLLDLFPEVDNVRRELVEGELVVAPPPSLRHQEVVGEIFAALLAHAKEAGGKAFVAPMRGDVIESEVLPGFSIEVDYLLDPQK